MTLRPSLNHWHSHARRNGFALLIAADPALAIRVKADGVHWPERLTGAIRRLAAQSAAPPGHGLRALSRSPEAGGAAR